MLMTYGSRQIPNIKPPQNWNFILHLPVHNSLILLLPPVIYHDPPIVYSTMICNLDVIFDNTITLTHHISQTITSTQTNQKININKLSQINFISLHLTNIWLLQLSAPSPTILQNNTPTNPPKFFSQVHFQN